MGIDRKKEGLSKLQKILILSIILIATGPPLIIIEDNIISPSHSERSLAINDTIHFDMYESLSEIIAIHISYKYDVREVPGGYYEVIGTYPIEYSYKIINDKGSIVAQKNGTLTVPDEIYMNKPRMNLPASNSHEEKIGHGYFIIHLSANEEVTFRIKQLPNFQIIGWTGISFLFGGIVIFIITIFIIYLQKKKMKQQIYKCISCGRPLRYISSYQKWYCDTCRKYS